MTVVVITAPARLVSLVAAKAHLRVEHDDEDELIGACLDAACNHIDGPAGWLGRAIGLQTLELRLDDFAGDDGCGRLRLPYRPVIDVVSLSYVDADGVLQALLAADWSLTGGQYLRPAWSTAWPTPRPEPEAVRLRYRAGYVVDPGADPLEAATPAAIDAAVKLMVGDLYANRETVATGSVSAVPMSLTVERLLAPYRVLDV